MLAAANIERCLETTERSTWQHSAISETEQERPHLAKQESILFLVGSLKALNKSTARRSSIGATKEAAAFGDLGLLQTCAIMQVYSDRVALSNSKIGKDYLSF